MSLALDDRPDYPCNLECCQLDHIRVNRPAQGECRAICSARRAQPSPYPADATSPEIEAQGDSLCDAIVRSERDKVAAVPAGFAIMIPIWITTFSFLPQTWLDSIGGMPAEFYCGGTIALWSVAGTLMYLAFRTSSRTPLPAFRAPVTDTAAAQQ